MKDGSQVYIFYDLETSELSKDFAQVFQIAMLFADDDMNLLSSIDLKSKRQPWIVPSPGAMLITGFTPEDIKKEKDTYLEMMEKVDKWIRAQHWPVTFVGYNSHKFDEHVLRQSMHQTLHDPFVTTARKNWGEEPNARADVLNMVKAAYLFAPGSLKLDMKTQKGNPSMTLGNVARQNGVELNEEDAHDALADIKATIGIAKVIQKSAPDVWEQMMKLTTKDSADKFLKENKIFAYAQCPYGQYHSVIGTSVTNTKGNPNEAVIFDLNFDPAEYMDKSVEELAELLKTYGDDRNAQPLQTVSKNQQPILMKMNMADPVRPDGLSDFMMKKRQKMIADNPAFAEKLSEAAALAKSGFVKGNEIEQKIFDFPPSFARKDLNLWLSEYHQADNEKRAELIADFPKQFKEAIDQDPSIKRHMQFAERMLYEQAPELIEEKRRQAFGEAIQKRIMNPDPDAPYMTVPKARAELAEIEQLRAGGDPKWAHVSETQIRSLKLFYTALEKGADPEKKFSAHNDNGPNARKNLKNAFGPKK